MKIQEGAQPDSVKDYKLPVTDVQRERRNFEGYEKRNWVTLDEWRQGDWAGSTDTDQDTDDRKDNPHYNIKYSKLNKKKGYKMRPYKSSSQHKNEN